MAPRKTVTLKDIAAAANVSRAAAARALNGYGYVGAATAERVIEIAAQLGYRGNRVAQALRGGQLPLVGFVPGDIQNPFFAQIAHDIDAQLRQSRQSLLIASSAESVAQERDLIESFRALNVRGVIVAPAASPTRPHLEALLHEGVPLVLIDRAVEGLPCDCVSVDNAGGARAAVGCLIAAGHRRVAVIHDDQRIVTARDRLAGYAGALADHGIALDARLIAVAQSTVAQATEATIRLFRQPDPPTALFTLDSLMTKGALLGLRALGLSVPRDVSLVGFDDFDLATFTEPQITVVAQPVAQIGPLAVRMLLERMRGSTEPPRHVQLPTRLIRRGSVAPPGGGAAATDSAC
ncbi:LacI family DNA-binding transcriptional regulator [Rhodobacter capsulatus]|jgi:LacI family transcriptional regulator|uniref:Transcriptional regulator, LacI family n=1 Tax=Rhodobacter capsulatus (strain ATCC BAA-309 / NBRC 16581 / SB1003) TaxID=272942 RepID=D5AVD2_RHOCB|nr:LacI family DNA-binding transcriptional regulator [Rhodobacter capsulatus]ADE87267.1 transcriptional regulator, LacI family [Rhodobacter capsulatus SB 1003]MDS0927631.1 LacI family transcriptional regulator [Rhodobacter capsulatus]